LLIVFCYYFNTKKSLIPAYLRLLIFITPETN
jgi:hypothetical protein